ncbi:adenylate/guanylate cyclase domain-containing protein [Oleiharenicola lentus]|uniref:adenylate/guanylate cyclase domain-containing protein n=1 Tax=Oleiharenicola lentus TaxID=2508720 RepID=UPI003F67AAFA
MSPKRRLRSKKSRSKAKSLRSPRAPAKPVKKRVRPRQPLAKRTRGRKNPFNDAGFVLICDIVDFSRLPHEKQDKAVTRLWSYLKANHKNGLLKDPKNYVVNGTGDGLMLAYFSHNTTIRHEQFIEFAAGMIKHMSKGKKPFQLRVGVTQGPFGFVQPPGAQARQAVGTGINQCARLVTVGDNDTVTVSEDFINKWGQRSESSIQQLFVPTADKPAHDVVIKRGELLSLRFYAPQGSGLNSASKKIESFRVVRELITRQLDAMEKALIDLLHFAQPELRQTPLDIRISVLNERRLNPFASALCTTDYRHHAGGNGIKAGTAYPLTEKGTGPVGSAYAQNTICVVHNLPEWLTNDSHSKEAYYRLYTENRPYDALGREQVDGFGRHARAFLTFPFSLMKADPAKKLYPDGAICIDIMQPLQGFTREQLEIFTGQLQSKYSDALAQLWRLRGQL